MRTEVLALFSACVLYVAAQDFPPFGLPGLGGAFERQMLEKVKARIREECQKDHSKCPPGMKDKMKEAKDDAHDTSEKSGHADKSGHKGKVSDDDKGKASETSNHIKPQARDNDEKEHEDKVDKKHMTKEEFIKEMKKRYGKDWSIMNFMPMGRRAWDGMP